MKLRKLEKKDASLMLEWMHDESVSGKLQADFASKTIDDCYTFIERSSDMRENMHLAIVDDTDTYMGTVSLKNIRNQAAEFAIVVRKAAMGKGYAKLAMTEMIRIGLEDLKLKAVYWCVSPENYRAIRFYEKNGYKTVNADDLKEIIGGGVKYPSNQFLSMVSANCGSQRERRVRSATLNTIVQLKKNVFPLLKNNLSVCKTPNN